MAGMLKLELLTPRQRVLSVETPWVTIPGSLGELGILPEHVPLVTTVDSGILAFEVEGRRRRAAIHYGYAQVHGDTVTVLAEMVERSEKVDLNRAQIAERRARETLKELLARQSEEHERMQKYEAKLRRSMVRQQLGGD